MLIELILIFILGLCVGSFINVLIDRIPNNKGFIKGRSYCDHCKKKLGVFDLVPLFSFLILQGKCRCCKKKISLYYPIVECVTAVLFVAAFYFLSSTSYHLSSIIYHLFIVSSLLAIFFIDLKYGIIPDKIVYPAIALSLGYLLLTSQDIVPYLLSALGAFVFFLMLLILTSGKGMGWGDVKFVILMGLLLGFPGIVVGLYLAFLTGAVVGVILILWRKKKLKGSTIPFGPFLVLGTILSLFYSDFFLKILMLKFF